MVTGKFLLNLVQFVAPMA